MKKDSQKSNSLNQEMMNQFGVILEDMNSKFDIMVEGLTALKERFDAFEKRLESLEKKWIVQK